MTDDKLADDIISTLEKLRAENPGDFMAVAEMRNAVIDECIEALKDGDWNANDPCDELRSLKSGGKNA